MKEGVHGGNVFTRESVGCVGDQETGFTDGTRTEDDEMQFIMKSNRAASKKSRNCGQIRSS